MQPLPVVVTALPWHCGSRKLDDVAILFGQVHGFGVRNNAMVTRTSRIEAEAVLRNRQARKMQSKDVKLCSIGTTRSV